MERISDHLRGRRTIDSDIEFNGLLDGDVVVLKGGHLQLTGTVNGDVIVEDEGSANIRGTVNGTVINNGGEVSIFGTVRAVSGTHPSHIDPNARVGR